MPIGADLQLLEERTFERQRRWFGEDTCDLIGPTLVEGGAGGDSQTLGPVATDIDCFIEELSGAAMQTVVGGEAFVSSHKLEMKRTSTTLAITPRYRIKVHTRDGIEERIFEKPVSVGASYSPLVVLKANLVRQGYQ